jgi:hypothetical protein
MKIWIDNSHNPLRGTLDCSHCHRPILHVEESWHKTLANEVSLNFPDVEYDKNDVMNRTPRVFYPLMMKKAAEWLAGRAESIHFCSNCGAAVQQPKVIEGTVGTERRVLPSFSCNGFESAKKWAEELKLEGLPVTDYHAWSNIHYAQKKSGVVIYGSR